MKLCPSCNHQIAGSTADEIERLRAENRELRAELERVKRERDKFDEQLWESAERLRATRLTGR